MEKTHDVIFVMNFVILTTNLFFFETILTTNLVTGENKKKKNTLQLLVNHNFINGIMGETFICDKLQAKILINGPQAQQRSWRTKFVPEPKVQLN